MKIRKASLKDLEEIKKLNQELFYHDLNFDNTLDVKWPDKNKNYYKKRITNKDSLALVVESEKKIIGYLFGAITDAQNYRTIKKIAELENMLILQEHRGKGIGKRLIKEFIGWAKSKKRKRIKVIASAQNQQAIAVYKNSGFSECAMILEASI